MFKRIIAHFQTKWLDAKATARGHRIIETKGKFWPQVLNEKSKVWEYIGRDGSDKWIGESAIERYCGNDTMNEAALAYYAYKETVEAQKAEAAEKKRKEEEFNRVRVHLVEPEAWVKLKE